MLARSRAGLRWALSSLPHARSSLAPSRCLHTCRASLALAAGDARVGQLISDNGSLWRIMSAAVSRTAQGRAYIQSELRGFPVETKRNVRWRSDELLEDVVLDEPRRVTVLYSEGEVLHVMDDASFEQLEVPKGVLLGQDAALMVVDGCALYVESYQGAPVTAKLPLQVTLKVVGVEEAGPTAILSTGLRVRCPGFIKRGDSVIVDTKSATFSKRE